MKRRLSKEDFTILYSILFKKGPKIHYKNPDSWIDTQSELFRDVPNWTPTKKTHS